MNTSQAHSRHLRIALVCKRLYTNKDLIDDHFGRLYHIPVQLAKLGHQVSVIALDYQRGRSQERIELERVQFFSIPAASVAGVSRMTFKLYSKLKHLGPDILIASGDTYIGGLTALIARILDRPWIFDVYDDYRCFGSARIPGMKTLFWKLLSNANHVFVSSKPLANLASKFTRSVSVIENGVDLELFRPIDKGLCRAELNIPPTDIVIGFFGSITEKRGIEILLIAAAAILPKYPQLRLLLAGKNSLDLNLTAPYVDYRGMLPQTSLPTMINACDVVTIPYEIDPQVDVSSPCKVAEYLACKVPVVVTNVSNMAEIFAQTPGVLALPGSVESLTETLIAQINCPTISPLPRGLAWANLTETVEDTLYYVSRKCTHPR